MRVLIVEDEEKTADYLHRGLSEQGFTVDVARDGTDGLHLALHSDYDVIVLDVMLPAWMATACCVACAHASRRR